MYSYETIIDISYKMKKSSLSEETISKINCKYIVKFYISRIIGDKMINKYSVGEIK